MFEPYLKRWDLTPDGEAIITRSSRLLPVRQHGLAAMLKVAAEPEEKYGAALTAWWDGCGAARVLAHHGDGLLLERARGDLSLSHLARSGRDDEASRIICDVVAKLHAPRNKPLPELIALERWFAELEPGALAHGGILRLCASTARTLLEAPQDVTVLHGDIHHDNILDFGTRGWLAIDPKRLLGERGFDYANLFCNPDFDIAASPACFARRLAVVSEAAGLDRKRLLQWILAWAGLSAVWSLGDACSPATAFAVAELAAAELSLC